MDQRVAAQNVQKSMKLYFISNRIKKPISGGELYNAALLDGAAKAGFDIQCWEGQIYQGFKKNVLYLNLVFLLKSFCIKTNSLLLLDTDFHARYVFALLWAKHIKKACIVGMLHHYNHLDKPNFFETAIHFYIERFVSKRFDFLITNSKFSLQSFETICKKSIPHQILTPFALDQKNTIQQQAVYDPQMLKIIQVSTIDPRKNIETTIKTMAKLTIPYSLDVVGACIDTDYFSRLQDLVARLGLFNAIRFHGRVDTDTLMDLYQKSTLFILVSKIEGYGMVFAEAMRYGLPIVASNTGAIGELVEDGVNGILCDPFDTDQIASAIERMADMNTWRFFCQNNIKKASNLSDRHDFVQASSILFTQIRSMVSP